MNEQRELAITDLIVYGTGFLRIDANGTETRVHPKDVVLSVPQEEPFPQPSRQDGKEPCGECQLQARETCDICGAQS